MRGLIGILILASFIFSLFAAWVTHVIWIIGKLSSDAGATAGQIFLGVIGAIMPPAGALHGYLIWFGAGF